MRVYGTVVWWKVQVKPNGLPDLFRFKSVDWIAPLNDDRALLSRDKLGGSSTCRRCWQGDGGADEHVLEGGASRRGEGLARVANTARKSDISTRRAEPLVPAVAAGIGRIVSSTIPSTKHM